MSPICQSGDRGDQSEETIVTNLVLTSVFKLEDVVSNKRNCSSIIQYAKGNPTQPRLILHTFLSPLPSSRCNEKYSRIVAHLINI